MVEVIGFGDDEPSDVITSDEDEEDTPTHPLDNASIAELLDKNSTTLDEKEFYRLTQKNTNFNSIKTNLLGKTNIEIGPIVGGTGGSSKPLVSIGTFETRNDPLRITKKIDEDSSLNDCDNTHRKFVTATSKATTSSTLSTTPSARSTTTAAQKPIAQVPTLTIGSSKSASSVDNSASTTEKSMQNMSIGCSSSKYSTKPTRAPCSSDNSSSTSTVATKTVNYTMKSVNPKRDSVDSSNPTSNRVNPSVTISSAKDLSQWSNPESKNGVGQGSLKKGPENKPALKPKSILKCSQTVPAPSSPTSPTKKNIHPAPTSPISNTIPPILSNKTLQFKGASPTNSKINNSLTNLIILTEGNSIASRRTSFLRDIIENPKGQDNKQFSTTSSTPNGVTIVSTSGVSNSSSLEPSLEKDSLDSPLASVSSSKKPKVPSKLALNIDLSLSREVANPPSAALSPSLRFNEGGNGSGTDSEFDDSLEDSGLDIKITKPHTAIATSANESSDGNKKLDCGGGSGGSSGSDSGNENDYTVSDNKCNGRVTKGHPGLYISVEDEELVGHANDEELNLNKKPPKLSPDSVLFNGGGTASGSEMSASGSNESIPESLREDQIRRSSTSTGSTASKRQAPQPPNTNPVDSLNYDDVYDDVVNIQMMLTRQRLSYSNELEIENESVYDDCSTICNESDTTITNDFSNSTNGNIGSYNFQQDSSPFGERNDDDEPVIMRKSDGIEFIGIRKIDSESFLKEVSPTMDRKFVFRRSVSPSGKDSRERSSSTSPKARRKVNQFFSTIGKKVRHRHRSSITIFLLTFFILNIFLQAGAAFSNSQLGQYTRNKSPSVFNASSSNPDPTYNGYKRSMSTDEVSAIRAQEIYATVTPTTMKFKGVLNKLSKIDLSDNRNKTKDYLDDHQQPFDPSKEKGIKKNHNIPKSIKKFLRFGNKDKAEDIGGKYDFPPHNHPPLDISSPIQTPFSLTSSSDGSSYNNSNPSSMSPSLSEDTSVAVPLAKKPVIPLKPPPPPPRIHSLDMLQKMGVVNQKGSVRPARPPPPVVRPNTNTPRFIAVFNNPTTGNSVASESMSPTLESAPTPTNSSDNDEMMIPPCKPKRKNSVHHSGGKDLETPYNHISNLNLETLKLIANQALVISFVILLH